MGAHWQDVLPTQQPATAPARSDVWIGPQQAAALAHLAALMPIRVLAGPRSSGKSTILGHLPRTMPDAAVFPVAGPQESAASVLATLLAAAGLGPCQHSETGQRNLLIAFFERLSWQGKRIVLSIDNVSGFSPSAWKEIERLSLSKVGQAQLIELVVAAAEEETPRAPLRSMLHEGSANAIEIEHCLSAPADDEVASYIAWKLARQPAPVRFSDGACHLINRLALGRYVAINVFIRHLLSSRPVVPVVTEERVRESATQLAALRRKTAGSLRSAPKRVRADLASPSAGADQNRLVVSFKDTVIREIDLTGRLMIGSAEDSDLHLLGRLVSRHHALIVPMREGTYYVTDLNSEHGLAVNGARATHRILSDGDVIGVGPFRLIVHFGRGSAFARKSNGAQPAGSAVRRTA